MPPKKKQGPPHAARGPGPAQQQSASDGPPPGNTTASNPGIDIVFSKPKPRARGHRQRGAGTVMADPGSVERDGVTVSSWQRLPSQLIQQHADRLQLKAPRYQPAKASEPELFCFLVVIPDRKNSAKDLSFLPTVSFSTAAQAKEHAALLALLKLQEDQPLERKLPEPYKTTWLQSVAEAKGEGQRPLARWEKAKKAREEKAALEEEAKEKAQQAKAAANSVCAGDVEKEEEQKRKNDALRKAAEKPAPVVLKAHNEFMSKFEETRSIEQKERAVKEAERKKAAWARSNSDMKVMMNVRLRRLLEDALGLTEAREKHREGGAMQHGLTVEALEGSERAVMERVQGMGFPMDDVLSAMAACPAKEDANNNINAPAACTPPTVIVDKRVDMLLEWLCLHLAEDELPKGFDPRGRMLDVIRPGQNFTEATTTATTTGRTGPTDIGGLGLTSKVETLGEDSVGDGSKSRTTKGEKGNVRGVGDSGEEEEEEEEDAKLGEAGERIGPLERRLLQYGFGRAEVIRAVATQGQAAHAGVPRGNDKEDTDDGEDALDARLLGTLGILAQGLNAGSRTTSGAGGRIQDGVGDQSEAEALEATDEEVTSLEAIYGNDVVVAPTMPKGSYLLTFDLKTLASMPTETWLDVWIFQAGAGKGRYPGEAAPLALVRGVSNAGASMPADVLCAAQAALAQRAASLIGNTSVYDLLVWAIEELPNMLARQAQSTRSGLGVKGRDTAAAASTGVRNPDFSAAGAPATKVGPVVEGPAVKSTADASTTTTITTNAPEGSSNGAASVSDDSVPLPRLPGGSEPLFASSSSPSSGRDRGYGEQSGGGEKWRRGGAGGRANGGRGRGGAGTEHHHQQHRHTSPGGVPPAERKRGRERVEKSNEFEGRRRQRAQLPAAAARAEFLSMARGSQVVLVSGETGCGKTTQIPQFLLEEWEEGTGPDEFRALVTQPRRIAAVGVAQRVADERCERVGAGVGYQIRGESKAGPGTRLLFCTTGLLLRRMQGDPQLDELTHLIVDEVHERHLDADFLLALLIGILPRRPKLKVILMSATLDTARFAAYFSGLPGLPKDGKTPILHIPGRTFPVRDFYLEDVLSMTGHRPRLKRRRKKKNQAEGDDAAAAQGDQEVDGSDDDDDDDQEDDHEELAQQERERAAGALGGLNMDLVDEDHLDYELIVSLILFAVSAQGEQHLGLHSQDEGMMAGGAIGGAAAATGSVLVFMPGTGEIDRLCRQLEHATEGGQGLWVLPLHGSLPPQKQRAVFDPAPRGMRKIVVSTNIAETSITIPDVTVVVDSCRVKEMGYDVARQMPRLQEAWASQDSLTQRKGRAGRVREGVSFKLIRRRTFARLPAHGTPEIRRVPLDPLVLQIKALGVKEHPSVVLARALDPPDPTAVQDAVDTLTELKALGEGAELTPLGWHLAALPCPVQVGKMIIYGAVLGCLSSVLSIAAGLSCRSPFLSTHGQRGGTVTAAKKRMAELGGGRSDHTLLAVAVSEWEAAGDESRRGGGGYKGRGGAAGDMRAKKNFCAENGLSSERMRELSEVRGQLAEALASIGFISAAHTAFDLSASVNAQAGSWRAVKAAVCAGLYPRVMRVVRPMERFIDLVGIGAVNVQQKAKEFRFFTRAPAARGQGVKENVAGELGEGARELEARLQLPGGVEAGKDQEVFVHPASINYTTNDWSCPWLVYHERVRTSAVFVRDCTEISPYALLLFGGKVAVKAGLGRIAVDEWVRFEAIGRIAALVNMLRQRLDAMLWEKIQNPRLDVAGSKLSEALVELLQTDGMG